MFVSFLVLEEERKRVKKNTLTTNIDCLFVFFAMFLSSLCDVLGLVREQRYQKLTIDEGKGGKRRRKELHETTFNFCAES